MRLLKSSGGILVDGTMRTVRKLGKWARRVYRAGRSHAFDASFYLFTNPDVAASGVDPATHYRECGRHEGRPARSSLWKSLDVAHWTLDRRFYLKKYPDVARAGVDPVWHFIYHGRAEGRVSRRSFELMRRWVSFWRLLFNPIRSAGQTKPATLSREQLFGYAREGKLVRLWVGSQSAKQAARFEGKNRFAWRMPVTNVEKDTRPWISVKGGPAPARIEILDHFVIGRKAARQIRVLEDPPQFVASVRDASVMGTFQVISHRQFIHFEPAADPIFDFVAGQSHFVAPVKNRNEVFVEFDYENTGHLEEALLISGRCGPNYYHWLIEYLGRTHSIAADSPLLKLPFIVDSRLYPQQLESLRLFFPEAQIYLHDVNDRLDVSLLHIPSIPTYLPDTQKVPLWQGSVLHKASLDFLRRRGLALLEGEQSSRKRRIYLTRRVGRMILNNEEVEALLAAKGFEICDTGSLTFREQVALFASASVIVGPLGAAFANVIFCRPGCSILGLVSPFAALFPLQARLAAFAGCDFKMLAGQQECYVPGDEDRPEVIAQDLFMGAYHIDIDELNTAVDQI